jgi:ATP-dependent helicase HepA
VEFALGQRWVSHADAQLGLGIVVASEGPRVTLSFPAVGEERTYAAGRAPLTRLRFKAGDRLRTADGRELEVSAVTEREGLLFYQATDAAGEEHRVPEIELDAFVQLTTPQQRLRNGHFDRHETFALRVATCLQLDRLQRDPARGLLGPRTQLLPHQLYIAASVGRRHAPRVLLADEVGLGKTIEAGMILHQQLLTGRASRVLVLVPEPLLHQWLVEMLRRFNLHFALFDGERLAASDGDNPFETEQLVLCAGDLLYEDPVAQADALAAPWDIVVVDEAHHLHWQPEGPGQDYRFVSALAGASPGLLLLTATPEQLGVESHFARLALIDPARFHDLDAFRAEEARYREWSELLEAIEDGRRPAALPPGLDEGASDAVLIERILDRHGTGRVLYRNTRASVGGFPARHLHQTALPAAGPAAAAGALYPERHARDEAWLAEEPRVTWLRDTLRTLRPHKALVICSTAGTAEQLEHYLHLRAGIRCAAFHEGLSIIERDRAAAWFADAESGAQALICSEIGSEGRNFQFAQHLVLFDLPRNPDLLEQRIGRLDRIGQAGDVHIHVPYLEGTAQERLFRWLHEGLDIFRQNCPAGRPVFDAYRERLEAALDGSADIDALIEETREATANANRRLAEGRDRLLERNACRPAEAQRIIEAIRDSERSGELQAYFETLCDNLGVEHEYHSEKCLVLRPGEHMDSAHFPELPEDGRTVTFDRATALGREDMAFLTWEHPMLTEAMEAILSTELGNAALGTLKLRGVPAGTLLLECLYTVNVSAPKSLQLQRFLSLSPQRVLVDSRDRDLSSAISHERLNQLVRRVDHATAVGIIRQLQGAVDERLAAAATYAEKHLATLREDATRRAQNHLGEEITRLESLQRVNPQVRDEEIDHLRWQREESLAAIARADLHLQAVRLVVVAA